MVDAVPGGTDSAPAAGEVYALRGSADFAGYMAATRSATAQAAFLRPHLRPGGGVAQESVGSTRSFGRVSAVRAQGSVPRVGTHPLRLRGRADRLRPARAYAVCVTVPAARAASS